MQKTLANLLPLFTVLGLFVANSFLAWVIAVNFAIEGETFESLKATSYWIGAALTAVQFFFAALLASLFTYMRNQSGSVS